MSSPSDADLLRRFVEQRTEEAFAELVRRHIDLVYRAALRRAGEPHRAQEIVQAVFTALAWKARTLVRHESLVGWLHTATRFAANDVLRAERRRRTWEQEASRMQTHMGDETSSTDWEKLRPVIDDALAELDDRDREAVLLRFFAGHSFAAIGAALRLSENTARMRVERALERLHGPLTRRGITSTSAAFATALAQHSVSGAAPVALAANVTGTALASTAAGLGQAAAALLTGTAKIQLALGAAALLLAGAAFLQNAAARHDVAEAENVSRQIVADTRTLVALQRDLETVRHARTRQTTRADAAANPAPVTTPTTNSQLETIRDNYLRRRAVARSNPEYQQLQTERRKGEANREYRPLLLRLKLPSDKVAQFESLLASHQYAVDEIQAAADTQRVDPWDPAIKRLESAEREKLAEQMRALLGESGYADYKRYRGDLAVRIRITDRVAAALYATDVPLTPTQAETLTQILGRHTADSPEGTKREDELDWNAAEREAKDILASLQFEALQALRAQVEWTHLLALKLSPMVGTMPPAKPNGK